MTHSKYPLKIILLLNIGFKEIEKNFKSSCERTQKSIKDKIQRQS